MKFALGLAFLAFSGHAAVLRGGQPIYEGGSAADSNSQFAVDPNTDPTKARPPNYRSAWDDCGGMGASATQRMRTIAAGIKGFAKPEPFKAHAGQDCGSVDTEGFKPGNRDPMSVRNLPGQHITMAAADGLRLARDSLAKYA